MVSVICFTYNHEPYIRSALDGFVMQKTNFKYEVLVHDDASTDNTSKIILEYAEKYPDIIKPQIEAENKHQRHIPFDTWKFVQGKYVAFCEGDDYWTDEYKLQKQYDAMEQNPDATMCVHKTKTIFENDASKTSFYPNCKFSTKKMTPVEYMSFYRNGSFHTSSHFMRASVYKQIKTNRPDCFMHITGDQIMQLYSVSKGSIYCISDVMSVYRRNAVGSWSQSIKKISVEKSVAEHQGYISDLKAYDEYTERKFSKPLQYLIDRAEFWTLIDRHQYKDALKLYPKFWWEQLKNKNRYLCVMMILFTICPKIAKSIEEKKFKE